jgi:hypothetical protein
LAKKGFHRQRRLQRQLGIEQMKTPFLLRTVQTADGADATTDAAQWYIK